MKKVLAVILAAVMVIGCATVTFARTSYEGDTSAPASKKASSEVMAEGVSGAWNYNAATNQWSFADASKSYKNTWALVKNPYASNASQWFYFDKNGNMLTGWVWIQGADGLFRCYYLNPATDGSLGACMMNGKTADGWDVDANGAWTVNGVVQTKAQ